MDTPEYISIDGKKIKINTDFRVAIKCEKIINDKSISDYERIIGIIYTLFDIDGIIRPEDYERYLKCGLKYLTGTNNNRGEKVKRENTKKDMDYDQDIDLIMSSMWATYGIDITKEKIHWWTFYNLLNNLPSDCIFNKVREIRNTNLNDIKDEKQRAEISKLKQIYSLDEKVELTEEQKASAERFYELTGIDRR